MESPPKNDMDQLLAALGNVGDFHSKGRFTLDYERSKLLLERFQLPTPAHFVYCIIAAAMLSFPSNIEITIRTDGIELSFDGRPFAQDELEQASGSLFLSSRTPDTLRLQELAIGMAGATRWGASHFEVDSSSPRSRINVGRGGLLTRFKGMFGRFGHAFDEHELQLQLCSIPSCQVSINKRPVPQVLVPKECLIYSHLGATDHPAPTQSMLPPLRNPSLEEFSHQDAAPTAQDLVYVFLAGPSTHNVGLHFGSLLVVLNGRQFRFELPTRLNNVHAVVVGHNFKKDLSQQTLAKFEVDALVADLERHQLTLLRHLAEIWTSLDDPQIEWATNWFLQEWSQLHLYYRESPPVLEQYRKVFRSIPLLGLVGEEKPISVNQLRSETPVTRNGEQPHFEKVFYYTRESHWKHAARDGTRTVLAKDQRLNALLKSELTSNYQLSTGEIVQEDFRQNDWELNAASHAFLTRDLFFKRETVALSLTIDCWCKVTLDPELDQGWIGELGLAKAGGPLGRVTLCHQQRPVGEVTLSSLYGYPDILIGLLEDPTLEPNFDCTSFHVHHPERLYPPLSAVSRLLSAAIQVFRQQSIVRTGPEGRYNSASEELRRALAVGLTHPEPDPELANLKLFELASKPSNSLENDSRAVSHQELLSRKNPQGALNVSRRRFEVASSDGQWVLLQEGWLEELMPQLFGATENIEIPLRIQEKRDRANKNWLSSERVRAQLDAIPQLLTKVLVRESQDVDSPGIGEIGCSAASALGPSRIHFLCEGRSLGVQIVPTAEECARNPKLRQLPPGLRAVINSPALAPNEDCSAPVPDQAWLDCISRLWQTLPQLALQIVPLFEQRTVPFRTAQLHFFQILRSSRVGLTQLALPEPLRPLLDARCLKSLCGTVTTLADLMDQLTRANKPEPGHSPSILYLVDAAQPAHIDGLPVILWFDPSVIENFQMLFHEFTLENAENLYLEALYHQEQESRVNETPQLPDGSLATRHIASDCGFSGLVGLVADSQIPEGNFRLRLLSNGKLVEQFVIEESSGLVSQVGKQVKPIPGYNELSVRRHDQVLRAAAVLEKPGLHHPLPVDFQLTICQLLQPEFDQLGIELYQELVQRQKASPGALAKSEESLMRSLQDYLLSRFPAINSSKSGTTKTSPKSERMDQLSAIPLFRSNSGDYVSMKRLRQELKRENRILYTINDRTSVPAEIFVLHSRRAQLANLKMILGPTALAEATKLERAYEAKDGYYSRPVQTLALPEHSYLTVWELSGASEEGASKKFSYRAVVGLHPNTDWTSTYTVYFDGRILETVRQVHPFSMEVAIEIQGLSIHGNYRGFERDEVFETVLQALESQVTNRILNDLPGEFHLKIIVEGRPTEPWLNLQLFRDTEGQSHSPNELKSGDSLITYYWPASRETLNPEALPIGVVPLVLSETEVYLLSKMMSRVESIEPSVQGAMIYLQQLPSFPERSSASPQGLQALHGNGRTWWLSDLGCEQQTLRFYWKQRLVSEATKPGWPGWTAHLDLSEHVLGSQGELPRIALHQAEVNSNQIVSEYWLAKNSNGELSLEDCKRCLPYVGTPGLLQIAIRKRLGIGRFEGYDGWELEIISKVVTGLQSLHQSDQVRVNFESLDRLCSFHQASDGGLVYVLNNKDPEIRRRIQNLSSSWLLTQMWNEFLNASGGPSPRECHLQLLKTLCDV